MATHEGKAVFLQRLRDSEFLQRDIQASREKSALEYAIVSLHPQFDSSERNVAHYGFEVEVYVQHGDLTILRDKVQRDWNRILAQYKNEPEWNSQVRETIAKAHKSSLCPSLEDIAEGIYEKEYAEAKVKFDEVVNLKKVIEKNKNHCDENGGVIDFPMWEKYSKARGDLFHANYEGRTEYRYKCILSKKANAAFLMASILSNAGESQLVQRELPSIIQHKSQECEFWYTHDWMKKDGIDKKIDMYENVAEIILNNSSPDQVVHFLTHSIPGGCYGELNSQCRNMYLHYAEKLPAPQSDQIHTFVLNSAKREFDEGMQNFYIGNTSDKNTKREKLETLAIECENLGDPLPRGRFYERTSDNHKALAIFVENKEWGRAASVASYIDGCGRDESIYLYLSGNRDLAARKAEKLGDIDMAIAMRNGEYVVESTDTCRINS